MRTGGEHVPRDPLCLGSTSLTRGRDRRPAPRPRGARTLRVLPLSAARLPFYQSEFGAQRWPRLSPIARGSRVALADGSPLRRTPRARVHPKRELLSRASAAPRSRWHRCCGSAASPSRADMPPFGFYRLPADTRAFLGPLREGVWPGARAGAPPHGGAPSPARVHARVCCRVCGRGPCL